VANLGRGRAKPELESTSRQITECCELPLALSSSTLDLQSTGLGFDSRPWHFRVQSRATCLHTCLCWVSWCLLKQRMMQVVVITGLLEIQVVQSSSQIITTNKSTSSFLQVACPSCHPNNSVKALKGKYHIPRTCLPQAHLGSSKFVSPTTNSSWYLRGGLPCLSSAL